MLAVALWFAAGVVLSRGWKGAAAIGGVLHKWVLWAALPALVLAKVPTMRLDSDAAVPVIAAWLCVGAGAAAVLIVARTSRWPGEVTGVMLLLVPLGNTSFLGLPVVSSLLGEDHLPAALAFDQLGTFLALATYGTWVAARYGNGDGRPADVALRIATFPPFVALAASFLLRQWPLTDVAHDALRTVGSTVAPAAMLATGLRLRVTRLEGRACLVTTGLALKGRLRGGPPLPRRRCHRWSPPGSWPPAPVSTRNSRPASSRRERLSVSSPRCSFRSSAERCDNMGEGVHRDLVREPTA
jgi:predicted permease